MDNDTPSPVIKRAARTYGRRRIEIDDQPQEQQQQQQPEDEQTTPAAPFQFAWRKALADSDNWDDEQMAQSTSAISLDKASPPTPSAPQPHKETTPQRELTTTAPNSPNPLEPPSPEIVQHRRKNKRAIVNSDSDNEQAQGNPSKEKSTEQTSSSSSAEEEQEDIEMGSSFHPSRPAATRKPLSKGKGRAKIDTKRDVKPLQFLVAPTQDDDARPKKPAAKPKIKPPTKRSLQETSRARARLLAEQNAAISITRDPTQAGKYTIQTLMKQVADGHLKPPAQAMPSSSPIQEFGTSSPANDSFSFGLPGPSLLPPPSSPKPTSTTPQDKDIPPLADSDDDEPPDISIILHKQLDATVAERRARELKERKMRALALASSKQVMQGESDADRESNDEDSDLEVIETKPDMSKLVAEEEAKARKKPQPRPSIGRNIQRQFGGRGIIAAASTTTPQRRRTSGGGQGGSASKSKFSPGMLDPTERLTQGALNRVLIGKVAVVNHTITRTKEEEWISRGGKGITPLEADAVGADTINESLKVYAERGLAGARKREEQQDDDGGSDDGDDEEDGDWQPHHEERGSASPIPRRDDDESTSENDENNANETDENTTTITYTTSQDITLIAGDESSETDREQSDKENPLRKSRRGGGVRRQQLRVIEDSDEENVPPRSFGRVLSESIEADSLVLAIPGATDDSEGDNNEARAELRVKPVDLFGAGAAPSSSSSLLLAPEPSLSFGGGGVLGKGKAVEWDDDDDDMDFLPAPKPSNSQAELADLFNAATEPQPEMPMTMDDALQPALQVSASFLRKADAVFEKEQGYVVEAANKRVPLQQELYVNDHGFLTQTRPEGPNPEVYVAPIRTQQGDRSAFSPDNNTGYTVGLTQMLAPSALTQMLGGPSDSPSSSVQPSSSVRSPLRTLVLSPTTSRSAVRDDDEDEDLTAGRGLRRLTKQRPTARSPSPSLRPNAFDLLGKRDTGKIKDKHHPKTKLGKSEYVQGEAQESDDEDMFGFGLGLKKKDTEADEDDGEDMDAVLEELVDDAEMDEETRAEHLVLEKVKEHQAEDDLKAQKLAQDAADGNLRVKRRAGFGLNESDDEDDDEDLRAKRIRQQMAKKRRIEGDNLEALGQNPETRAFYDMYQHDLNDDDNRELAHLMPASHDVEMTVAGGGHRDTSNNDTSDEEQDEPMEVVTVSDIRNQLRAVARQNQDVDEPEPLDPHDVSWMDEEDRDKGSISVRIKAFDKKGRKSTGRGQADVDGFELPNGFRSASFNVEHARLRNWAQSETRSSRVGATGRSTVGSAVTGHGKKVKAGGGSLRSGAGASTSTAVSSSSTSRHSKPLRAAPSVLAGLTDRSAMFG